MDPALRTERREPLIENWLVGGGEMGKVIRAMDWRATPLGPIAGWPQSLRTTVSLCLASNFPISIAWGPSHVQIYNDGYWPICGGKHPRSMGQDFSVCWASAWPAIGEAFERALRGETSYLENQRMFLDRNGYLEETFFTFSFSPIRDETGGVGGLFHPVTETTPKMVSERRTRALRELTARAGKARAVEEVFVLGAQALAEAELDVPFALLYVFEHDGRAARLVAQAGIDPGTPVSPTRVNLEPEPSGVPWPLLDLVRSNRVELVSDLSRRLHGTACGPYPEPPDRAFLLPITPPGAERPLGALIAGTSSRLPMSEPYRAFIELLAAALTTAVANARAYEEERRRVEALAEIDRAKIAFFSNVSHEFRTPLTLMLGPLEDELEEPLPPVRRERLETAHRNALRLLKLVNTLLDFSRIEAGRMQASFEPVELSELTADLASMFRSVAERAGLRLEVECAPLGQPVYVDRDMWEKVVLNLLSNAFKHTFEGKIRVALGRAGERVELVVEDSGVGIPEAELPKLFERFHRVKGSKSRTYEGTGIGLALVRELVSAHAGSVTVASMPGRGSIFKVSVPLGSAHLPAERVGAAREPASASARAEAYVQEALHWLPNADELAPASSVSSAGGSEVRAEPPAAAGPRARILWADDNSDMRDYVRRLLASRYDVIAVPDGLAALDCARAQPPELVLSDVMMPGLDGFGLLAKLRADPVTRTVPVILLSARAGEESAVEGLAAGADDYLMKPFSARELLARVRTHLELARLRRESALEVERANQQLAAANLELERANRELEAFSYSVSHDLRGPLRSIDGFTRVLRDRAGTALDETSRRYLERVCAATSRMSDLIDDLLDLSRVSRAALRRERFDLAVVAREIVSELRRREPERRVRVSIAEPLEAHADPVLITSVLENLLGNAWKFSSVAAAPEIVFERQSIDGEEVFVVRDNGAGFDMEYANKLFEPFSRLHSQAEFAGTGIGLSIVQRVVARHGGRIWVDAAVGRGATFFFTLGGASS